MCKNAIQRDSNHIWGAEQSSYILRPSVPQGLSGIRYMTCISYSMNLNLPKVYCFLQILQCVLRLVRVSWLELRYVVYQHILLVHPGKKCPGPHPVILTFR